VRYGLGFYIPEDDILHSHRRENLKSSFDIELVGSQHEAQLTGLIAMM
jgi:hypothetical protein